MPASFVPKTNGDLKRWVRQEIAKYGPQCDLNHLDVSGFQNMHGVFKDTTFNGDISKWNVSKVNSMHSMFKNCPFDGNISNWDVSSLEMAMEMFEDSSFNGDISKWNTKLLSNTASMFKRSAFNGDISQWDTSALFNAAEMFQGGKFNGDISNWNVDRFVVMSAMFANSAFDGDLSKWNPLAALRHEHMDRIFEDTAYSGDLSHWVVSRPEYIKGALGPRFCGVAPTSDKPITKAFYDTLFGSAQRLNEYLRTQAFGGVHFDVLRLASHSPDWAQQEDFRWARELAKTALGVGMTDTELHAYSAAQYAVKQGIVSPAIADTYGVGDLVCG